MSKYQELSKEELLQILEKKDTELARKYGIFWDSEKIPEKVVTDCENNLPVLERVQNKSIKTNETTDNILIEGDNYHALTVLNYTHKEKIDVIYIDPPYNTGNKDFTYNDRYVDKEDGYRHSKWLNFMEKRLKLAKNLLIDKGVIFISIDDNEQAQLKLLCDQVFGEFNYLGTIIQDKQNSKNDTLNIQRNHEYILVYRKSVILSNGKVLSTISLMKENTRLVFKDEKTSQYFYLSDPITTRGEGGTLNARKNLGYTIYFNEEKNDFIGIMDYDLELAKYSNDINIVYKDDLNLIKSGYVPIRPPVVRKKLGAWTWDLEKFNSCRDYVQIKKTKTNSYTVKKKIFVSADQVKLIDGNTYFCNTETSNSRSIISYSTNDGTDTLNKILTPESFNNPKNIEMIKYLLELYQNKDAKILDFMAGSGTTGQAVLELNKKDGGNRHFILCNSNELNGLGSKLADEKRPENMDEEEFEIWKQQFGICQRVTYPRLEKVINGYNKNGDGDFVGGLGGNLQYYKTDFVKRVNNRDQIRFNLMNKCTEMLCVKESIFEIYEEKTNYKTFISNDKKRFLCVYYNFTKFDIDQFVEGVDKLEGQKQVYIFSETKEPDLEPFYEIKNCRVEAIPEPIFEIYEELIKLNK